MKKKIIIITVFYPDPRCFFYGFIHFYFWLNENKNWSSDYFWSCFLCVKNQVHTTYHVTQSLGSLGVQSGVSQQAWVISQWTDWTNKILHTEKLQTTHSNSTFIITWWRDDLPSIMHQPQSTTLTAPSIIKPVTIHVFKSHWWQKVFYFNCDTHPQLRTTSEKRGVTH